MCCRNWTALGIASPEKTLPFAVLRGNWTTFYGKRIINLLPTVFWIWLDSTQSRWKKCVWIFAGVACNETDTILFLLVSVLFTITTNIKKYIFNTFPLRTCCITEQKCIKYCLIIKTLCYDPILSVSSLLGRLNQWLNFTKPHANISAKYFKTKSEIGRLSDVLSSAFLLELSWKAA